MYYCTSVEDLVVRVVIEEIMAVTLVLLVICFVLLAVVGVSLLRNLGYTVVRIAIVGTVVVKGWGPTSTSSIEVFSSSA